MTELLTADKKLTEDQLDRLGKFADRCLNLKAALDLPMPPQFHMGSMRDSLDALASEIKLLYIEVAGENPWE